MDKVNERPATPPPIPTHHSPQFAATRLSEPPTAPPIYPSTSALSESLDRIPNLMAFKSAQRERVIPQISIDEVALPTTGTNF